MNNTDAQHEREEGQMHDVQQPPTKTAWWTRRKPKPTAQPAITFRTTSTRTNKNEEEKEEEEEEEEAAHKRYLFLLFFKSYWTRGVA